jgi:amino acid transporter
MLSTSETIVIAFVLAFIAAIVVLPMLFKDQIFQFLEDELNSRRKIIYIAAAIILAVGIIVAVVMATKGG